MGKKLHSKLNRSGYTLVELMIAASVFSVIMLGVAGTVTQVGRMYYKGVISSRTQNIARSVNDEVSRAIQFSNKNIAANTNVSFGDPGEPRMGVFCVGQNRYTFAINVQVSDGQTNYDPIKHRGPHALLRDRVSDPGSCDLDVPKPTASLPANSNAEELLEQNMRLKDIAVQEDNGSFKVLVSVIYGDDDLLVTETGDTLDINPSGMPQSCTGSIVGGQWCAFSTLETNVTKRLE